MKYTIIERGDAFSDTIVNELHQKLGLLDYEYDEQNPEIIFTVGGDGTILKAIHSFMDVIDNVVFVGIHTGKLGFYTDFVHDEIDKLIVGLKSESYCDLSFNLLEAKVCKDEECLNFYALNEITLINAYKTQHFDVFINDEFFESFQGTGVCVSTPSGSSAYNKSLGGALVHPMIEAFQLTEIGSINNNVYRTISSPMIFPKEHILKFKHRDFNEVTLTIDHMHKNIEQYNHIDCRLSEKTVKFRQFRSNDFWNRVKKSFL